jgi:hypothetical protein
MSEHNEEAFGEMAALSRRMARIEIALTERILALEGEVAVLKASRSDAQPQGQGERTIYPDARIIEWREDGAALATIDGIMQR